MLAYPGEREAARLILAVKSAASLTNREE